MYMCVFVRACVHVCVCVCVCVCVMVCVWVRVRECAVCLDNGGSDIVINDYDCSYSSYCFAAVGGDVMELVQVRFVAPAINNTLVFNYAKMHTLTHEYFPTNSHT